MNLINSGLNNMKSIEYFQSYVNSLSEEEKESLFVVLQTEMYKNSREKAKNIQLNETEKEVLALKGTIDCITSLRARIKCDLITAKEIVDNYRRSIEFARIY
jgi:hypothetical protein